MPRIAKAHIIPDYRPLVKDLETLRCTTAADFDGHTEFHRLSPLERLAWLDEAVAFITSAKAARQSSVSPAGIYPGL